MVILYSEKEMRPATSCKWRRGLKSEDIGDVVLTSYFIESADTTGCKPHHQHNTTRHYHQWNLKVLPVSVVVNYDTRDTFLWAFFSRTKAKVTLLAPAPLVLARFVTNKLLTPRSVADCRFVSPDDVLPLCPSSPVKFTLKYRCSLQWRPFRVHLSWG